MVVNKKTLVVVGATGMQGGSVVDAFLDLPEWNIRGITRSISSPKARNLSTRGVEMVEANLDDMDSLIRAFSGANVIFGVTDFWKPLSDPALTKFRKPGQKLSHWAYEYELQQGKRIFDAAATIGTLERLVFSTTQDVAKDSEGKYTRAYHADSKAHAEQYGRQTYPDLWSKTSTIQVGMYLSNFAELATEMPQMEEDGSFSFINQFSADTFLPLIAADQDTGPLVKALLNEPPGTKAMGYRAWMRFGEFIEVWSRALGVTARVVTLPIKKILDRSGGLEPDIREMLAEGMANMAEFGYKLRENPVLTQPHQLQSLPPLDSIEDWIKNQDWSAVLDGR